MVGKFITVEGCEGVGKTTLLNKLKEYFKDSPVVFTREPGGTAVAEKIRSVILDADNAETTALTELLLYAAARAQHTEQFILPMLNAGKTVICDRYSDSTLAYQGYGRGMDKDLIRSLNSLAQCGKDVDLTVFLDLSPEEGFKRKGGADSSDRLEQAGLEFHKRVYVGFCEIAEKERFRVARIDASRSADEVFSAVLAEMMRIGVAR